MSVEGKKFKSPTKANVDIKTEIAEVEILVDQMHFDDEEFKIDQNSKYNNDSP